MPTPAPIDHSLFAEAAPSESQETAPAAPQLLLRVIVTPSAAPWDQARAADMEARLQAPLPLDVVAWKVRRLEPWRPGAPARFLAGYLRRTDVGDGVVATEIHEGRKHTFEFVPRGQREAAIRRFAVAAGAAGIGTLVMALAVVAAFQARGEAQTQLTVIELQADRARRQAASEQELVRRDRVLTSAGMDNQRPARVLADLAWIAQNRVEGVGIEGVLWEPGLTAVEVRGEQQPVAASDRNLRRASSQVRPGVNVWGVSELGLTPQEAPE